MTRPQVTLFWQDLMSCWGELEIEGLAFSPLLFTKAFSLTFRDEELRFLKGARPSPSFGPTHPSGKNLSSIHSRRPNSPSCGLDGVQQYSSQNSAASIQFDYLSANGTSAHCGTRTPDSAHARPHQL